jgi:hypothetical protein
VGEASKKSEQGPIVGVVHSAVHGGATYESDDGSREEPGDVRRCEWRGSRSTQRTSEALGGSTRRTNDGIREPGHATE